MILRAYHLTRGVFRCCIVAAVMLLPAIGCDRSKADRVRAPAPSPPAANAASVTEKKEDSPLLLDDGPAAKAEVHNSRCHVCHLNLEAEELVVQHAKVNIGCAKCHGESDAHIADESWGSGGNGTPPDKMFPPDKINPMCLECHPKDKLDHKTHRAFLAGASDEKYCVNCHGKHKLPVRKCKWK